MTGRVSISARSEDPNKTGKIIESVDIGDPHPFVTDTGMAGSGGHNPINKADNNQQPETLTVLCQHMQTELAQLPRTAFSDDYSFSIARRESGLYHIHPPEMITSQPSVNESV